MEFTKHGSIFFTQAKVSKVLNLVFNFFCIDFLGKSKKEFVIMFISRQVEKCVLVKSMHYPMQEEHVIYFYYVARLESDLLNQCV